MTRDLVSPLLGPVQTAAERTARAEAEEQLSGPIDDERIIWLRRFVDAHCEAALTAPAGSARRAKHRAICAEMFEAASGDAKELLSGVEYDEGDDARDYEDGLAEPFCACGRRWSQCDGSRRFCGKRYTSRSGYRNE